MQKNCTDGGALLYKMYFHPECIAFHKMYNEKKQLVPCTAKIEITRH